MSASLSFELTPTDNERLSNVCGALEENLRHIEKTLGVELRNVGHHFEAHGSDQGMAHARSTLFKLYKLSAEQVISRELLHLTLHEVQANNGEDEQLKLAVRTKRGVVRGRNPNQEKYLQNILAHDLNFGVGPAGTGKTYLAVAAAVHLLEKDEARRLVLVRPAVEAGEKLGFLPGDLTQKVDPYLRPLYDALYEMMGFDKVARLIERNVIEIAPLAFMRGRTLNEAVIILDEAQNTTIEQMKMFLTRIGFGSTAIVTGDATQIDLPKHIPSGLKHALQVLDGVAGISVTHFEAGDVVRHPLVQKIVRAYERFEKTG